MLERAHPKQDDRVANRARIRRGRLGPLGRMRLRQLQGEGLITAAEDEDRLRGRRLLRALYEQIVNIAVGQSRLVENVFAQPEGRVADQGIAED